MSQNYTECREIIQNVAKLYRKTTFREIVTPCDHSSSDNEIISGDGRSGK
jgi:hypothetical protein